MTKNLTLAVDEDTLASFRIVAAEKHTTVNALIRKFMEESTGLAERRRQARCVGVRGPHAACLVAGERRL